MRTEGRPIPFRTLLTALSIACCGSFPVKMFGQVDTLLKHITLDEFVVTAQAQGFSVEEFVGRVMTDTTFQQSFLNSRYYPHHIEGGIRVRNKNEKRSAAIYRKGHLERYGPEAELILDSVSETGKMRDRKGEMRYLTAQLHESVFFPRKRFTAYKFIKSKEIEVDRSSRMDKYKSELKKFMFNPGQEIASVPFIGEKFALYSPEMNAHYDHRIWSDERNGVACWVFSSDTKPGHEDDTVILEMDTWFDQRTNQVLAREYHVQHASILLDFDIRIKVRNVQDGDRLLPVTVNYAGEWDIPFKKIEIVDFDVLYSDWGTAP